MQHTGYPLGHVILDEIALEGLEGVTLPSLWLYVCDTLQLPAPMPEHLQQQIWEFIKNSEEHLRFYELPNKRETVTIYKRFENLDADLGLPLIPVDKCPYLRYKCAPVQDGDVIGSCELYKERKEISIKELRSLNLVAVSKKWGNKFIIVGSQNLRYKSLTAANVPIPKDLTPLQYCMWEAIGRSRSNGEATGGAWSLLNYCKDSTIVFYIKNRLIHHGVITSQSINEKRLDRLQYSTLLTLPRFHATHKSQLTSVIEKLFQILKEKPSHRMTLTEARSFFSTFETNKTFKKICVTHLFRRVFDTQTVPYSEIMTPVKPKNDGKERQVQVISLRNPNMVLEDFFSDDIGEEKDEDNNDGDNFYNEKHTYVDMPLKDAIYRAVERFGPAGCSQSELCNYLSIHYLAMRQLIKKVTKVGIIKSFTVSEGRQRFKKFVVAKYGGDVKKTKDSSKAILKNLQCADEPNLPAYNEMADVETITGSIKPLVLPLKYQACEMTPRHLERKTLIVKAIDQKCIVQVCDLRISIQQTEKETGYKDECCMKSVRRLLLQLEVAKVVCLYEITLKNEETVRTYQYVTHPKIHIKHEILNSEILKLKNNFFLLLEEKRLRHETHLREVQRKVAHTIKKSQKILERKSAKEIVPVRPHKPPKFLISRYLHEFLFYIVVELNECQSGKEITEELLQQWQLVEPALQIRDYMQTLAEQNSKVLAYTNDISWRTFIPPLPKYSDKPASWVFLLDAIERMPLSLFSKIFGFEQDADARFAAYLAHPVRQHYLMRQLPADLHWQNNRIHLHKIYLTVLKVLNCMGLVQVSDRRSSNKDPLLFWVYLNRQTELLDTTPSEARYATVNPERKYEAIKYEFSTFDDVTAYWSTLHRICVYTRLGFRRGRNEKCQRLKELSFVRVVDFDEAPAHDTGEVPGNRSGAGGLSTNLLAHALRNWSWVVHTNCNPKATRPGRNKNIRSFVCVRKNRTRIKTPSSSTTTTTTLVRRLQPSSGSSSVQTSKKKKTTIHDAIDRDALKNMRTLRVSWSKEEDQMLKLTRATYVFLAAPVIAFGRNDMGRICRDVMRHTLDSYNKTTQACIRRIQFMIKRGRHLPEVPTLLHLLQTNAQMEQKYGNEFLTRLKKTYPNRTEFREALMKHFIFIMQFLYEHIKNIHNSGGALRARYILPDCIEDFLKQFRERPSVPDEHVIEHLNPGIELDLQVVTIINVLHSAMCCVQDKSVYALQAFEIYKNFSEEVLNAAFSKARKDALVVAVKRKHIHSLPRNLAGTGYLLSSRYRSRLNFLKIPYGLYEVLYKFLENALSTLFDPTKSATASTSTSASATASTVSSVQKQTIELKSPHLGQLFFIAECLAENYIRSSIKLPINILTVDADQRQNLSSMDRILDHYHGIFDNAPQTEYTKNFESESNEKQIRVKFHPANLSHKIHYNPFDFIAKLPTRYLHFFCALDHLQHDVDINFSKLHQKDEEHGYVLVECPFNCIMKNANYINAIERIVQEKKSVLNELSEMPPQKLLNMATSGCSVTVQPTNLLTLVRMLESFWREKEMQYDRKDLGKISTNLKANKSVDWHQLCNDILAFNDSDEDIDKIDEYEPTLNKEERIARAQDVFVVNLPTLYLKANTQMFEGTETIERNGAVVPQLIVESEIQRDAILEKIISESFWKYTENTFETLKPQLHKLQYNAMEQKHLEEVHNFIERHKYGVSVNDLLHEFPYEQFLLRALHTLADHYLIKRAGVATFMYIHKTNIRPWLVHTFHVKRLERESLGSAKESLKRAHVLMEDADEENEEENSASTSKKGKLNIDGEELGKRVPKPVQRFEETTDAVARGGDTAKRDVIVMKPRAWMRLNGSLNRRVLDRWLGAILTECVARSGCTVQEICLSFPHMMPADVMFLIEILGDLKCIHLTQIQAAEVNLFSQYENIKESIVTELYDPVKTYVTAHADAVMRFTIFVGHKKYAVEFV